MTSLMYSYQANLEAEIWFFKLFYDILTVNSKKQNMQ